MNRDVLVKVFCRLQANPTVRRKGPKGLLTQIGCILSLLLHRHRVKVSPDSQEIASVSLVFQAKPHGAAPKRVCPGSRLSDGIDPPAPVRTAGIRTADDTPYLGYPSIQY